MVLNHILVGAPGNCILDLMSPFICFIISLKFSWMAAFWWELFLEALTWDQALFSFRFENYIPAGKTKRKESLIQTFNEMSAAHFFDWLTFAESANQNYFRCLFF